MLVSQGVNKLFIHTTTNENLCNYLSDHLPAVVLYPTAGQQLQHIANNATAVWLSSTGATNLNALRCKNALVTPVVAASSRE